MRIYYFRYILALTIFLNTNAHAQVPYEWPIINSELVPQLGSITQKIDSLWTAEGHKSYCTRYAGDLLYANSNRGYSLFTPTPPGPPDPAYENYVLAMVDTMLIMMDTMGYKSVDITISYPLLVDSFPNSKVYLDFYKKVYAMARSLGFKIIENCQVTLAADSGVAEPYMVKDIDSFYYHPHGVPDTLNTMRYLTTMTRMMQTVIDSLTPDYLTLEMEPQTQQVNLYNLLSFAPDTTLGYVNYFLSHLTHKGNILYGAGAGTWNLLSYFENYATTSVDYIDYHLYLVNGNEFNNMAFLIDSVAQANGKQIVVGECWANKNSDSEFTAHSNPGYYSALTGERNVFGYFEGIDTQFTQAMINLSQQANIDMVNFFNTNVEFGYIDWQNSYNTKSISQITSIGVDSEYANMFKEKLGPLGLFTKKAVAGINCSTAGVNNLQASGNWIEVYPNPASTKVRIDFGSGVESIEIDNLLGQCLTRVKINNSQNTLLIDVGNLSPGIYFTRLLTPNGCMVKKFVKE